MRRIHVTRRRSANGAPTLVEPGPFRGRQPAHTWLIAAILPIVAACGDDTATAREAAPLRAFAFPSTVEPKGSATVAIEMDLEDCATDDACTICVALPSGAGRLSPPAGVQVPAGGVLSLPSTPAILHSMVYTAPDDEGSDVVSVSAFVGSGLDCTAGPPVASLRATTTTRIVISHATTSTSATTTGAGGDGGAGGSGGASTSSASTSTSTSTSTSSSSTGGDGGSGGAAGKDGTP